MSNEESAVIKEQEFGSCCHAAPATGTEKKESSLWWRLGLSIVLSGQLMVFGLGYSNAEEKPLFGSGAYWGIHGALIFASLLVIVLLAGPLFRETWKTIKSLRVSVEALFFLSILGAFGGSLISTLTGQGIVYYEVVAVLLVVYTFSVMIASQSREKARQAARDLKDEFSFAHIVTCCGKRERVHLNELNVGDKVDALPGELVTVDGKITQGTGYVRETALTGEINPVVKRVGDFIRAGSYAVDASFKIKATRLQGDRAIDKVLATLEEARSKPSRLQEQANVMMQWFLPIVVGIAVSTFVGWTFFSTVEWWQALFYSMAVLLVACPCALGLATPIALWGGLMKLSEIGLVARSGRFLDDLAHVDLVVFDKTGTLSEDDIVLGDLVTHPDIDREKVEAIVAAAEDGLDHPIARALAGLKKDASIERKDVRIIPGAGIEVSLRLEGRPLSVLIGERTLFPEEALEPLEKLAESSPVTNLKKKVYIAFNGQPVAVALLEERLRMDAQSTLKVLHERGIESLILTGDPDPKWSQLANAPVESGLDPSAKEARIKELRAEGRHILFVGDGINDSAAMTQADCSVAMASGSDLTRLEASAVCVGNKLETLPQAIDLCREVRRGIYWNMRFAAVYNVTGMGIAAAGLLHPVVAAFLMVAASATVSFRALRACRLSGV